MAPSSSRSMWGLGRVEGEEGPVVVVSELSVLLTDVEGSTRLWEAHPEAMAAGLADHDRMLREVIAARSGQVFGTAGDSFAAAFPTVASAVEAAVAIQLEANGLVVAGNPLRLRMGIHFGEVELRGSDYFGAVMNRTGRVRDTAHGGQIILTQVAYDQLNSQHPNITYLDLGEHRLRDLAAPIRLHQVCAPGLATEFPPVKSLGAFIHNLPTQLTSFVGRSDELNLIDKLVADTRHASLLGPGGSGKTRLALQYAADTVHHYPDGAWFIDLRDLTNPTEVPPHIAATLRVITGGDRPLNDQLVEALWHRQLLLILDNCEHVLDAIAPLVDRLLQRNGTLRILATTRQPLGIPGETILPIHPLPTPTTPELQDLQTHEAAQLFVDRASQANPNFNLGDNLQAVFDICQTCEGLPLALELAAARLRTLTPQELADRLHNQLATLKTTQRTGDLRHATIEATIQWSWNLLTREEQTLLARLSIFQGTWALHTAETICGYHPISQDDILDLHTSLIDKSLIATQQTTNHGTRYRLLEPIRQYTERQLDGKEHGTLKERCIRYWATQVPAPRDRLGFGVSGTQQQELDRQARALEPDQANLTAAIEWALGAGQFEKAMVIIGSPLGDLLRLQGIAFEAFNSWMETALLHQDQIPPEALIRALDPAHAIALTAGRNEVALAYATVGMELARNQSELHRFELERAIAINRIGRHEEANATFDRIITTTNNPALHASVLIAKGEEETPRRAWELYRQAVELSPLNALGLWTEEVAVFNVGYAAREVGRYDLAADLLERSLELSKQPGFRVMIGMASIALAGTYTALGRLDEAETIIDGAVSAVRHLLGSQYATASVLLRAASTARLRDKPPKAHRFLEEARRVCEHAKLEWQSRFLIYQQALITRDEGNLEHARDLLDGAVRKAVELDRGDQNDLLPAIRAAQVGVELRDGNPDRALNLLPEVLARLEGLSHLQAVEAVDLTAIALSQRGLAEPATLLIGANDRQREETGLVVQPPDCPLLEEAKLQAGSALGDGWDAEYAKGRSMTLDEAVELATRAAAGVLDDS